MTPEVRDDRRRSVVRRPLLVAATVGTALTLCIAGYLALRLDEVVNDCAQHGSPTSDSRGAAVANLLAWPAYRLELHWRFARMEARWQRGVDRGLCPEERVCADPWARFWYREGYLDALPDAFANGMSGITSFSGPSLSIPARSYQWGLFDGERVVQRVISDFLVEQGMTLRWNGKAEPTAYGSGEIRFSGTADEHREFEDALALVRKRFGAGQAPE